MTQWPKGIHYTFSQHAAATRASTFLYSVIFIITTILLSMFFFGWFIPRYALDQYYASTLLVGFLTQILCTFVSETGSDYKMLSHRILAGLSAFSLLASQVLLLAQIKEVQYAYLVAFSILSMSTIVVYSWIRRSKIRYALLLQFLYYSSFSIPVIFLSL